MPWIKEVVVEMERSRGGMLLVRNWIHRVREGEELKK